MAGTSPCPQPLWRDLLGGCLRAIRHERGETLGDTATRAGISPQYLSEIERGVKDASSEMVAAVAGALEVTVVELALAVAELAQAPSTAAGTRASCRAMLALAA